MLHNNYQLNGNYSGNINSGGNINTSYSNTNSLPRNGGTTSRGGIGVGGGGGFNPHINDLDLDDRGRSKKRNFFGTLKKRLGRSKTRTHSADRGAITTPYNNNGTTPTGTLNGDSRSLSVDRAVMSKSNSLGNFM